ncbi:MAG: serine hydrolase [Ekhidna sp.]|nr:serine hydrolase [Ekhidna sp.]MBC6425111.1 serine hydrolase [Ekhidna sp.]
MAFFAAAQLTVNTGSEKTIKLEKQIDSILFDAIRHKAFPGCVVYASQKDRILFFKSYGHYTYDSIKRVENNSIYDLASITKVVGGTLALMKLYEDSLIHPDDPIKKYVDGLGKRVGEVTIREALAHQGGLYPWIPYYQKIRKKNGAFKKKYISNALSEKYPFELSDNLFLRKDFYHVIKRFIKKSEVTKTPSYKYSGLFFYLVPELVEKLSGQKYTDFLQTHFFDPLKAKTVGFSPLDRFSKELIAPTEVDSFFRMEPIHGKVHDEGAIMMQGVSGNAGLFSNAIDLAKVMQLLLNDGVHDTLQLLKPHTIDLFNTVQYPNLKNRRALGFDKPLLQYDSVRSSVAKSSSRKSFGHTGYTGTLAWADPKNDLVYIFLSNRVYPSRKNTAIYKLNVRPVIHQLIYDYLGSGNEVN